MSTTTKAKATTAVHVTLKYSVCLAAAALAIVGVQWYTHNALNQTVAGLIIPVLGYVLAQALVATGLVSVPDAPATVDVTALAQELAPLVAPTVEVAAGKGAGAEIAKALAPVAAAETATTTATSP